MWLALPIADPRLSSLERQRMGIGTNQHLFMSFSTPCRTARQISRQTLVTIPTMLDGIDTAFIRQLKG
jgi:hypothetical protein